MAEEDQKAIKNSMEQELQEAKRKIGNNYKINKENKDPFQTSLQVLLDNTKRMKEIIKTYGWPTFDLVGKDGSEAAWLLVQHGDLELQKMSINLLKSAADINQARKSSYAFLLDRLLIREGKKQLYGTQLDLKNGELIPFPIEDEKNVNKRRNEMGMKPLQEYINNFPKEYIKESFEKK
ncbi:MAG: hypothetical protein JXB44_11285 [Calditrichaceae bacterium]|nr:hypothetical protein [Calditrichaceae bacterium]RQV93909.1 MAG: hypothetical protein EH224_11840 [Calditrichota bacterium]